MRLALDTETHVTPGSVPPLVCTSFTANGTDAGILHVNADDHERTIIEAFNEHTLIFANSPFDAAVYGNKWDAVVPCVFHAYKRGSIHDVLNRDKLKHIAAGTFKPLYQNKSEGFGLGAVMRREFGIELTKDDWRLRYCELEPLPIEAWPLPAVEYAQNDALSNWHLFHKQEDEERALFNEEGVMLFEDEARQNRAHFALHLMGLNGICIDQDRVREFSATITKQWEEARDKLIKTGLVRCDGSRDTKLAAARMEKVCAERGIDPKGTAGGGISLDQEACERVCDELLDAYSAYGSLLKLKGTYIEPLERAGDEAIHPYWNPIVDTGRISCLYPNLTQLPRAPGVRECYVASIDKKTGKRKKLIFADYDKSEIVSWAQIQIALFGSSVIGDAINKGMDPHSMMAATFLGCSYEEAHARYKAHEPLATEARQTSKPPNFMLMGGAGVERYVLTQRKDMERDAFAKAFPSENPFDDGERHKAAWLATWHDAPEWFSYVKRQVASGSGSMRSYKSHRLSSGLGYSEYANRLFQQLTADYAKEALWDVTWEQFMEPDSALYGTRCVVFVHDEIGLECEEDRAPAAAKRLEEVMVASSTRWCPDVRSSATARILDRWSK